MSKRLPLLLTMLGVVLLAASFLYDAVVVGMPPQDAPPAVAGEYARRMADAAPVMAVLRTGGLFSLILGGFLWLVRVVLRTQRGV